MVRRLPRFSKITEQVASKGEGKERLVKEAGQFPRSYAFLTLHYLVSIQEPREGDGEEELSSSCPVSRSYRCGRLRAFKGKQRATRVIKR
jgi:hypothetical protein